MKNRIIKKVAILGSGIMGSRIACHFANIGVEVLLLDIVPNDTNDAEKAKGLTLENPARGTHSTAAPAIVAGGTHLERPWPRKNCSNFRGS